MIAVNFFQTALEWWNEVPQTAISLVSGAIAGTVSTFVAPWVQWGFEKKRELRQHRRKLIADWYAMIGDVSKRLDEIEKASSYTDRDVFRLLARHANYASFQSTYAIYSRSGVRGLWLRFRVSGLGRMLWRVRLSRYGRRLLGQPKLALRLGRIVSSSPLSTRIDLTIVQIAKIETWWKLHK
jgi:hypothetical protein